MKTTDKMKAPIVLFVYNRPEHTQKTLDSLAANFLANESELFIYSDAPKNQSETEKVKAVRYIVKNIKGFKSVNIIERDTNWGLAGSIIDGVTNIVNKYGKVIVLEDDMVTSPFFLQFMNKALDYYKYEKNVWHVSGWNYPINSSELEAAFFWRTMNCWGWATWKDRWRYFEKNVDKLIAGFPAKNIYKFDINGAAKMWQQVLANKTGEINSWAVFWYAAIFQKNGLCLNPAMSFVQNIGFDGTGVHSNETSIYSIDSLCEKDIDFSELIIEENDLAVKRISSFYKEQLINAVSYKRLCEAKKEIFIFGAGSISHSIINVFPEIPWHAFIDNDESKTGKPDILPIISFQDFIKKSENAIVFIPSNSYTAEMRQQLIDYGFSVEYIVR